MEFLFTFDFKDQLSIYVHIPFCFSKCSYCAFYSCSGTSEEKKEEYTKKLVNEINEVTSNMSGPFYTAFIGGGNPLCLNPSQLERICSSICKKGRPLEFTCEMNPESFNEDYFFLFDSYLTRASMGVQSLSQEALTFLGRNANLNDTLKGITKLEKLGQSKGVDTSFDMITCLGSFHNSLDDIKSIVEGFNPNHLSVYSLTLEEGTELFKRNPTLPDSDGQFDILIEIWDYLEKMGYEHYEVSNFAKNGRKSLHNSVYWSYQQYIGLGCASASTAIKGKDYYRHNCCNSIDKYITSKEFQCYESEKLTNEQKAEELVLVGLRHSKGLDLTRLEKEFGYKVKTIPEGYRVSNGFLIPEKKGFMTCDAASVQLTAQFIVC